MQGRLDKLIRTSFSKLFVFLWPKHQSLHDQERPRNSLLGQQTDVFGVDANEATCETSIFAEFALENLPTKAKSLE